MLGKLASAITIKDKKKELRNFLRNSDIFTITQRGVATQVDTFSGNSVLRAFVLTKTGVKNIRSVVVSSVTLVYGKDYTFSEVSTTAVTTLNLVVAPGTATNNIVVTYDWGITGDRIYDDFPQDFVTTDSYPRIGFDIVNTSTSEMALDGTANQSNILLMLNVYALGQDSCDGYIDTVRSLIVNNKKSFYYWNFLTPENLGPIIVSAIKGGKVYHRGFMIRARYEFEL